MTAVRRNSSLGRLPERWFFQIQHCFPLLVLATPAYVASTRILGRGGYPLEWYHRAGLAASSLLLAASLMVGFGLILHLTLATSERIVGKKRRRNR